MTRGMLPTTNIKVDQVWESEDPRDIGRRFEITGILRDLGLALCRNVHTGRQTAIAIRRLRHIGKRGYRLVEDDNGPQDQASHRPGQPWATTGGHQPYHEDSL